MSPSLYNRFDRPLRVELAPSRLLSCVWLVLCLLAAGSLYSLSLSWPLCISLLGLLTAYGWFAYRLHIRLDLPNSIRALAWDARQGWQLRRRARGWQSVELCLPVLVTYRVVALRLQLGRWHRVSVIVVADRTDTDDFRRLRVRLLQSAHGDRDRTKVPGA